MFNWLSDLFSGSDSHNTPSVDSSAGYETSPSHGDFSDAFSTACPNQICAESNYGELASHSWTELTYSSSTDWCRSSMSDIGTSSWD